MKSKLTISIASILSVLVLVGVGFAAWVIINPNVKKEAAGNIEVDTVTDNSYDINAEFVKTVDTTNGTIVFGKKDDTSITNPWLTNADKAEKLTATLTLTAQNFKAESWAEISKKTLTVSMKTIKSKADDNGFSTLVTSGYIAYPTLSGAGVSKTLTAWTDTVEIKLADFTHTENATTATYELTITFAWGDHFKTTDGTVENPYVYYNKKGYAEAKDDASNALTAIHKALDGVSYEVSIKEQAAQA